MENSQSNKIELTPDLKKRLLKALTADHLDLNDFPELLTERQKIEIEIIDKTEQVDPDYIQ